MTFSFNLKLPIRAYRLQILTTVYLSGINACQKRISSKRLLVPVAQKFLNKVAELDIRAAQ